MTLSVPSFLAASTSAAIPPRALAEVAVEALTPPLLVLSEVLVGGEQAAIPIRVTAASIATPLRRAIRFFTSDLRVGVGLPAQASVEMLSLRCRVAGTTRCRVLMNGRWPQGNRSSRDQSIVGTSPDGWLDLSLIHI